MGERQPARERNCLSSAVGDEYRHAIADEIADKLGAETVSVQSMNVRQVENSQSLVLAVEFQIDGPLSSHWQYGCQMLRGANLGYSVSPNL